MKCTGTTRKGRRCAFDALYEGRCGHHRVTRIQKRRVAYLTKRTHARLVADVIAYARDFAKRGDGTGGQQIRMRRALERLDKHNGGSV